MGAPTKFALAPPHSDEAFPMLDLILFALVAASALFGLLRGLVGVLASIAAWLLAGWAAWLGNAAAFVGLPLFVAVLNLLQIAPEERVLRERFGDAFTRYAARVRRWI